MKPFYWLIITVLNAIIRIVYRHQVFGVEHLPPGAAILAANHASFLDPPIIGISCPEEVSYLAREQLFKNPFFKKIIVNLNSYPIADTGTRNIDSFKTILGLLSKHKKVCIFPEGYRTYTGQMQPLKTGVAMIALRANCPVVPIYIHGTYQAWPRTRKFPRPGPKTACVFGTPIYPNAYVHLDKKHAQEAMTADLEQAIVNLRDWYSLRTCPKTSIG